MSFVQKGPLPIRSLRFYSHSSAGFLKVSRWHFLWTEAYWNTLRLFIHWAHESTDKTGQQFVLTHPDFDVQNLLVEDDGTLCGIIDWDGVAAVPHAIGCLSLPLWLTEDAGHDDCFGANEGKPYHTPEELQIYRAIYAQFIEIAMSREWSDRNTVKRSGDITRLLILTSALEIADNDPFFTDQVIAHLYSTIKQILGDIPDLGSSDMDSLVLEDFYSDAGSEQTEATEPEQGQISDVHCERCIAEARKVPALIQEPQRVDAEQVDEGNRSEPPATSAFAQDLPCLEVEDLSRKARIAKYVCGLGEKGLRKVARVLHRKRPAGPEAARVLGNEDDIGTIKGGRREGDATSKTLHTEPSFKCICNSTRGKTQALAGTLHREADKSVRSDNACCKIKSGDSHIKTFFSWLLTKIRQMCSRVHSLCISKRRFSATLEAKTADVNQANTEHSEDCPIHVKNLLGAAKNDEGTATGLESGSISAPIAVSVEDEGIPLAQIGDRDSSIAGQIVESMKKDSKWSAQLKKQPAVHLAATKVVTKTKQAAQSSASAKAASMCEEAAEHQLLYINSKAVPQTTCKTDRNGGLQAAVGNVGVMSGDNFATVLSIHQKAVESQSAEVPIKQASNQSDEKTSSIECNTLFDGPEAISKSIARSAQVDTEYLAAASRSSIRKQIARDKPCPCGSKPKFKKCCGRDQNETTPVREFDRRLDQPMVTHYVATHSGEETVNEDVVEIILSDDGVGDIIQNEQIVEREAEVSKLKPHVDEHHDVLKAPKHKVSSESHGGITSEDEDDEDTLSVDYDDLKGRRHLKDDGSFTMDAMCVALGNKNLDKVRLNRLRKGFDLLVDELLGRR